MPHPHRVFDHVEVRCPMLGGPVRFGYCREVAEGLPCHRALVCFELQFPVQEYFRRVLHQETFDRCFTTPTGCRYEKLLGAAEAARHPSDATPDAAPNAAPDVTPDANANADTHEPT